jgi:serine/threonine protein kinase
MTQQIGRYIIQRMIGSGGMATVYQAYDGRFQREVAIKMLHQHSQGDKAAQAKFEKEAQIIAKLEHSAIVPVYDYGEHEGQPYLVMRLMTGGSLKERLMNKQLSLIETANILGRICSALDKAHAHHVVHRDIKPGNILFDEDGMAYLGDFGIARLTDATQTTSIIGSPRYMAPEQAQGLPLDNRTDVYQMGVVLFEMLTGRAPFNAETTDAILYQHVHLPVPLLLEINPKIPPLCDSVVGYAMAKHPDERYSTAGELALNFNRAVRDYVDPSYLPQVPMSGASTRPRPATPPSQPTQAINSAPTQVNPPAYTTPYPTTPPPAPAGGSNRTLYTALGGGVLIMFLCGIGVAILGWNFMFGDSFTPEPTTTSGIGDGDEVEVSVTETPPTEGTDPEDPTTAPVATVTLPSAGTVPAAGVLLITPEEIAQLAGGSGLITYAAERGADFNIYVTLPNGAEKQLTTYSGDDFRPVFSPDGSRIAYHSIKDTWDIWVMNADGTGIKNLSNHSLDDSFPQWSPDGTQIAFHSNRNNTAKVQFDILVMNADGTNVRAVTTSEANDYGPSWSPDGTKITFQREVANDQRHIFVVNRDGSGEKQLTSWDGEALFPTWSPDGTRIAFYSDRDGEWSIYTMAADGSDIRRLTNDGFPDYYPMWSPNGQWLLFHSDMGNENRDLWLVKADGSEEIRLTNTPTQERNPDWKR